MSKARHNPEAKAAHVKGYSDSASMGKLKDYR